MSKLQSVIWSSSDEQGKFSYIGLVVSADDQMVELFTQFGVMGVEATEEFLVASEEQDAEIREMFERSNAGEIINVAPELPEEKEAVVKMKRGAKKDMTRTILLAEYDTLERLVVIHHIMDACKIDRPLATSYYNHHSQCLKDEGLLH